MLVEMLATWINLDAIAEWGRNRWLEPAFWAVCGLSFVWGALMFYDFLTAWWTWLILIPLVIVSLAMLTVDLVRSELLGEELPDRRRSP